MYQSAVEIEDVPEYVGKTDDIVGIDEFILHYALWSNSYSTQLHAAGIRFDPEVKTLVVPYGLNYHIQVFNPVAGFWQAVTYIGLLALYEEKFASGQVTEISGDIGAERISVFGISITDADIARAFGVNPSIKNIKRIIEDIKKLSMMSAFYSVKSDEEHEGCITGTRWTKKGDIRTSRTLRFVHDYIRRETKGKGANALVLDRKMVEACHDRNFVVNHKKLIALRSKLKSTVSIHEIVLGLYLFLLGNKAVKKEDGRFHIITDIDKFFQITAPKKPADCTGRFEDRPHEPDERGSDCRAA